VAAVSKGPLPARGETIIPFATANHQRTIEVTCKPEKTVLLARSLFISVKSPHSTSIRIVRGTRRLTTIAGDEGRLEIPASVLGPGPVRLLVIGAGDSGPSSDVHAPPLEINVEE
jgi:hypothetical protein